MRTVLVTGGAGFIGSNFIRLMLAAHADWQLVNADALTYAGNLENLEDVAGNPRYTFVKTDTRDREQVERLFADFPINAVVNFAAESHVDRSIVEPEAFLTTNVLGTQVLLETAKRHWKVDPADKYSQEYRPDVTFVQVSTDEVYGALGKTGRFTETMPLLPNSPYSASKAAADLLVRSYHKTFGLPVNITRCSNNYGPYQFPEKLIPLMICNCLQSKSLPVYGDGMQIRDWIHVHDHCAAIEAVLEKGEAGEIYNIGGNSEQANIDIVKLIVHTLGKSEDLITYVKDRPGHDRRYAIDASKIKNQLGWQPRYTFENGLKETIAWYQEHLQWIAHILNGDYQSYYAQMYEA